MDVDQLRRLSGITSPYRNSVAREGSNISVTGNEKARIQRERNIQPGTPEWFQLWFSLPYLTGEPPVD